MGEVVLHHGTGALDFQLVGPAWESDELRHLIFNARRILTVRGQSHAGALLDAVSFSIFPATNHFNDDFHVLHAGLPLAEYEAVRLSQHEKRQAATQIVEAISEANGPYIRFVAVGLALADPGLGCLSLPCLRRQTRDCSAAVRASRVLRNKVLARRSRDCVGRESAIEDPRGNRSRQVCAGHPKSDVPTEALASEGASICSHS